MSRIATLKMGVADAEYAFKQLLSSQHESIWEILKGQYHCTLKSQKRQTNNNKHVYRSTSSVVKIGVPFTETINKCLWLRMAGIEMDLTWELLSEFFFKVFALVSDKIGVNWFSLLFLSKFNIWFCFLGTLKAIYAWSRYSSI